MKTIEEQLQELREKWKTANKSQRELILMRVKILKMGESKRKTVGDMSDKELQETLL